MSHTLASTVGLGFDRVRWKRSFVTAPPPAYSSAVDAHLNRPSSQNIEMDKCDNQPLRQRDQAAGRAGILSSVVPSVVLTIGDTPSPGFVKEGTLC
jgi:hypothetical protein